MLTTQRLRLRPWLSSDLDRWYAICNDPEVMRFLPGDYTKARILDFFQRMDLQQEEHGHCYWAAEELATGKLIGFTGFIMNTIDGIMDEPFLDIGWRFDKDYWNKGLATEAARASIAFAKAKYPNQPIYAVATVTNTPSIAVMKKLGMPLHKEFNHPLLKGAPQI